MSEPYNPFAKKLKRLKDKATIEKIKSKQKSLFPKPPPPPQDKKPNETWQHKSKQSRQGVNERHEKFIKAFLTCGSARAAAVAAGYSPNSASSMGASLLKNPRIQEAIKKASEGVEKSRAFTLEVAMKAADDCIEFAKQTNNANAYAKTLELKMKLNGLLIEKHDVRNVGSFAINIMGIQPATNPVVSLPPPSPQLVDIVLNPPQEVLLPSGEEEEAG